MDIDRWKGDASKIQVNPRVEPLMKTITFTGSGFINEDTMRYKCHRTRITF